MRLLLTIILIHLTFLSNSQESGAKFNSVELYYPNYYFRENYKFHLINIRPNNIGISFVSSNRTKNKGFHISFDWHEFKYNKWRITSLTPGVITNRYIGSLSYGLDKSLIKKRNLNINWFGELNFRIGAETFWYGTFGGWEPALSQREMYDLGVSIGTKISYSLPWNLSIAIDAKQSVYYFRWYNVVEISENTPSWDIGTPITSTNINLKLGYTFNKKK